MKNLKIHISIFLLTKKKKKGNIKIELNYYLNRRRFVDNNLAENAVVLVEILFVVLSLRVRIGKP